MTHQQPISAHEGLLISDRYRLIKSIGEGGMGAVWLAEQVTVQRKVVLKLLKPELCQNEEQTERFRREATLACQLKHPNSVVTHDFGVDRGLFYIVMEHLEGEPLSHLMYRRQRLPIPDITHILTQVCFSLKEAHEKGMVHRDLKPENIFVLHENSHAGLVKVLDFGIAKLIDSHPDASASNLTRGDMIFGTPQYMAPEQIRGKSVDARTDIYALGVMLYQGVSGRLPYDSAVVVDILTQHLTEPVPSLSAQEMPALNEATLTRLNELIGKLMAKDPRERLGDVSTLIAELNALSELAVAHHTTASHSSSQERGAREELKLNDTPEHTHDQLELLPKRATGEAPPELAHHTESPELSPPAKKRGLPVFKLLLVVLIAASAWVYVKMPHLAPGGEGWDAWGRGLWSQHAKPQLEKLKKLRAKGGVDPQAQAEPAAQAGAQAQAPTTWQLKIAPPKKDAKVLIYKGKSKTPERHALAAGEALSLTFEVGERFKVVCLVGKKPKGVGFEPVAGEVRELSCP